MLLSNHILLKKMCASVTMETMFWENFINPVICQTLHKFMW